MHEHFNVSVSLFSISLILSSLLNLFQRNSGCRCIVGQYLLATVIYAQDRISQAHTLADSVCGKYTVGWIRILASSRTTQSPHITITCDVKVSYTFYI